jgi:hypothetical protein
VSAIEELRRELKALRDHLVPLTTELARLYRLEGKAIVWANWRAGQCDALDHEETLLMAEVEKDDAMRVST